MAKLALYLFGPPRVELDGQPIEITRRKSLALLIYLVLNPGTHGRDTLATLFWPGYSQTHALGNLRRALFILNRTLPGEWFETDRQHLALRQDADISVDVVAFRSAAREHATAKELERAASLFGDDFLAGFTLSDAPEFDDWLAFESESLTLELADLLEQLVRIYRDRRDYAAAISHARRRVGLDPLYEPGQRRLMRLYVESGQNAAALHQYQECVRVLQEELSIPPAEETIALYRHIRHGKLSPHAVSKPLTQGVGCKIAEHRADGADKSLPVPVYDQPYPYSASPERHPDSHTPNNLPHQLTPLIGRERELAALDEMLVQADMRLVTIVGPGGIGKTRLGLAAGASSSTMQHFHQGVFFVALAPLRDPKQIAPAVAEALHFRLESGADQTRTPQQQVSDYLREKQMLLVLDNFEHLLEGVEFISDILETAPDVKILVTSRERLRFPGEHVYPIQGLDTGASSVQYNAPEPAAVRLFVQSAQRALPEFVLSRDNLGHVTTICQLVQGMPLAIELAAAWVELLLPTEIVDELRHSLDFLTRSLRGVPERHHSIRAVFDATWHRLDEEEQILFAQLSIFKGGFTRGAAFEVTGATLHQLSALAGRSLVEHRIESNQYTIHELLRQYGEDQLSLRPKEEEGVRGRHATYYCGLIEMHEGDLEGAQQRLALTALDSEIENIQAAWQWVSSKKDATRLVRVMDGMGGFYQLQGRYHEGAAAFRHAKQGLDGETSVQAKRVVAKILTWLGAFARITGGVDQARRYLMRSLGLLDELEATNEETGSIRAFALLQLGNLDRLRDAEAARELYTRSLLLYEQLDDSSGMANAQEGLGIVASSLGDNDELRRQSQKVLAVHRVSGDRRGMARALDRMSRAARRQGHLDESLGLARESEALYRQIGDQAGIAKALSNLGDTLNWLGRIPEAQEVLQKSVAINRELGDPRSLATALGRLASSHSRTGEYDVARREGKMALSIWRELDDVGRIGFALMVLGKVAMYSADYEAASRHLEESVATLQEKGTWVVQGWTHSVMGCAAWGLGDLAKAREHILRALHIGVRFSDFNSTVQSLQATALLLSEGEDPVRALEIYSLVGLHPKVTSPQWFGDVVEPHFANVIANLPPEVAAAAQECGRNLDVWETAAKLLRELEK